MNFTGVELLAQSYLFLTVTKQGCFFDRNYFTVLQYSCPDKKKHFEFHVLHIIFLIIIDVTVYAVMINASFIHVSNLMFIYNLITKDKVNSQAL